MVLSAGFYGVLPTVVVDWEVSPPKDVCRGGNYLDNFFKSLLMFNTYKKG